MNTTDRSTGTIDYALRRRFAFVTLKSDRSVIEKHYNTEPTLKSQALALFDNIEKFIISNTEDSILYKIEELSYDMMAYEESQTTDIVLTAYYFN